MKVKPTSFGIFNKIYSSSLTFLLKHHYACRELCLRYEAMSATILLYNGEKDKLVSEATYLHRQGITSLDTMPENEVVQAEKMHMMRFIGFYHYVFFQFISTGIPDQVSDEKALSIFKTFERKTHLSYGFPQVLEIVKPGSKRIERLDKSVNSITRFVQYCIENSRRHAAKMSGEIDPDKFYFKLYETLREEYVIGEQVPSFSSRVFHRYRDKVPFLKEDSLIFETETDLETPGEKNVFSYSLDQKLNFLGFRFKVRPFFIGLPLLVNGRCIGVIRLLYFIDPELGSNDKRKQRLMLRLGKGTATEPKMLHAVDRNQVKRYLKRKGINRSLLYSIQTIGHFIDRTFPEVYFQQKPKRLLTNENLCNVEDDAIYDDWCTDMRNALNSHECSLTIRGYGSETFTRNGTSEQNTVFEQTRLSKPNYFLVSNNLFNAELEKVFPEVNEEKLIEERSGGMKAIAAFIIEFDELFENTKILSYYYTEDKDEVRPVKDASLISDLFENINPIDTLNNGEGLINRAYHSRFTGQKGNEASVFKGKYKLIIDIPAPDVCGVVVFSNSINRKFTLLDIKFAYAQVKRLGLEISFLNRAYTSLAVRTAIHPLRHLVTTLNTIIEMASVGKPMSEESIAQLNLLKKGYENRLDAFDLWLGVTKRYITYHTERESNTYSLLKYLTKQINGVYSGAAGEKGIYIDIEADEQVKNLEVTLNQRGLWNCIDGIVGNAVERAYDADQLLSKQIPDFARITPGASGNIKVKLKIEDEFIRIEVSNYGDSIDPLKAKSFGRLHNFSDSNSSLGRGVGLFIVKEHLTFLRSDWIPPWPTDHGSTFCVRIKI